MEKIGRYTIERELGRGGMGIVYAGVDPRTGLKAAIKTLASDDAELLARFEREARAAAAMNHPNIVKALEWSTSARPAYLALEFVSGRPLEDWTKANYAFTPQDAVTIVAQVAAALDYAHNRGVVHRDIKPGNILVTDTGISKVTDFGVSKKMDSKTLLTQVGTKLGSPYYMPPEQILESGVDGRADQFSLAVIAYELLAGRKPFYAEQIAGLLFQIVQADPPNLAEDRGRLGAAAAPILRALSKDPKARFASCTLFAWALAGALGCPIDIPLEEERHETHGLASLAARLRQWFESGLRKVFSSH